MLYWDKLLNPKRFREATSVTRSPNDGRSPFKKDFDTVCNSSVLRRLQDKAQVFPLEQQDYARTRLLNYSKDKDAYKDTAANLLYLSLSATYRYVCEQANKAGVSEEQQIYNKLLLVTDQISGMTDSHAMMIYNRITAS